MSDLHERTLDMVSGLLKSRLRFHIYKRWAEKTGREQPTLMKVERGFVAAHREVWAEFLGSRWDVSADNPPELLDLILQAVGPVVSGVTTHFESLPEDWLADELRAWQESFQPTDIIAEGVR